MPRPAVRRLRQRVPADVWKAAMSTVVHCMLCGKEGRIVPEDPSQPHYYLCAACARVWLADWLGRAKARLIAWLPWIFAIGLVVVMLGALRAGLSR